MRGWILLAAVAFGPAHGQVPQAPAEAAPAPQRVEITGGRPSDADERRESTASKIVIGRDEIERFGDGTVGEVLKRLPGVTIQGPPGRGGAPRMRGLGGGYTQILLDGQRLPRGFSLDALSPDQIERIEVIRAPTAETGARAIGGTINIVLREGLRQRQHELRLAGGAENGRLQPSLNWSFDDRAGDLAYNVFASVFRTDRESQSLTTTVDTPLSGGEPLRVQQEASSGENANQGLRAGARLQWRLGDGESLTLQPFAIRSASTSQRHTTLAQTVGTDPPYAASATEGDGRFALERLNGQWRTLLADGTRLETTANASHWRSRNASRRDEFDAAGAPLRAVDDRSSVRERRASLSGKGTRPVGDAHGVAAGLEFEALRRAEDRTTLQDGIDLLPEFGETVQARSTRAALYLQDEWTAGSQWAFSAGLRWEGIETVGGRDADTDAEARHTSRVWSPLLHAVWKPDAARRDQWRLALTRSYRSPTLQNLIARPTLSPRFPVPGPNEPTSPDRAGNPALRPELATGLDLAFERYLDGGGVLSANVFVRHIRDLIRSETTLETVGWSDVPRWVSRPRNVGDATTRGVELEAKFRLSDVWPEAPPVDLRANASAFRSAVGGVPGPDNRLDKQPDATANLGADWRLRGWPLTVGGNVNWTPGYRTALSAAERVEVSAKRVFDAYALWRVNPSLQWRLSANNVAPRDGTSVREVDTGPWRTKATTLEPSAVGWQLRLELKL